MALTAKQERFVQEYLVDLNATQAAIRAGYSVKSAARIAVELLNKTHVSAAVDAAMDKRTERTGVTQDQVVKELKSVAFAAANDCSDSDLKVSNKLKALELLGRHLGMFTDKVEQSGDTTIRLELGKDLKDIAE